MSIVLLEGASDRVAVETLALRLGRDLGAEGVCLVELGGATNVGPWLREHGGDGVPLLGLYDEAEERFFRRGLQRAGRGGVPDRDSLEALGFFACSADLEDELIRSLGEQRMLEVIDAQGELASLHVLQQQPAQRDRTPSQQLRRFLGTRSGRKSLYARAMVATLDLDALPSPLERLLSRV